MTQATQYEQAEHGKTELSLVHFSVSIAFLFSFWIQIEIPTCFLCLQIKNPKWKPTDQGAQFISTIKENGECETLNSFTARVLDGVL